MLWIKKVSLRWASTSLMNTQLKPAKPTHHMVEKNVPKEHTIPRAIKKTSFFIIDPTQTQS